MQIILQIIGKIFMDDFHFLSVSYRIIGNFAPWNLLYERNKI